MENVGSLQVNEKSHSGGSINRNSLKAVSRAHTRIKSECNAKLELEGI